MARLACAELFDPAEVAILHVMGRVVRRCFLLGNDPIGPCASQSGKRCSDKGVYFDVNARLFRAIGCNGTHHASG